MAKQKLFINTSYDPLILRTIVRRYWLWVLGFVGIFVVLAYFYLRYTKPVYESSLMLQISNQDKAADVIDFENINTQDDDISAVVELLRSELLFERAVDKLNMSVSMFSRGKLLTEELYLTSSFNIQPYELVDSTLIGQEIGITTRNDQVILSYSKGGKNVKLKGPLNKHLTNDDMDVVVKSANPKVFRKMASENELYFTFNSRQGLVERLHGGLDVIPMDPNARTIQVSFKGHNARMCRDLSLAIAEAYQEYDEEINRKSSENVLSFINNQLDSLYFELQSSQDSLADFHSKSSVVDPELSGGELNEKLNDLELQLSDIDKEVASLIAIDNQLERAPNRLEVFRMIPEMLGKSYEASLVTHITDLHDLLEQKEDLLVSLTPNNEKVALVQKRIDTKINTILRSIATIKLRLNSEAVRLRQEISRRKFKLSGLPEQRMEYSRLKNIQELNEKYFTLLTEKKVLYSISDAGYASENRILRMPTVSTVPVAPNGGFVYFAFILVGTFIGLGIMTFRYLTFNEINLIEDLENTLPERASILGGVPLLKFSMEYSQLVVAEAPKSIMAEAMRKIRTNLSYIHPNYQTIAISSSISGEGKTFVALNLGGIIAMSGKRTILLDLDLRKPKVHLGFDEDNTHGMSSLIVGQSSLEECIKKSTIPELDFITAGPIPPNPSELLLSDRFKEIVEELKGSYDVIIIDNPPVGLVSDGVKNLTEADIPIYIFKSHYSKRNFTYRIKELFEMQQLKSLNVILNGVQSNRSSSYGYGYGYGYGFGYGYTSGYMDDDMDKFSKPSLWMRIKRKIRSILRRSK